LKEGWSFPRGSEALSIPEYRYAIVILSESFIPTPSVVKMTEDMRLDIKAVESALALYEWEKAFAIDYVEDALWEFGEERKRKELTEGALNDVIEAVVNFLLRA